MIHYILQTLAIQLLFLLVYDLFLKKETFFNYNRLYLIVTPILSLVLPFIQIAAIQESIPPEYHIQLPTIILGDGVIDTSVASLDAESSFPFSWIWYLGALVSCILFGRKLFKLMKLKKRGKNLNIEGLKVISVEGTNSAFTFLNYIFLGAALSEEQKTNILLHEQVHVKQKHSLDQLFFEFLRIVFWFNPLVYVFQNRITELQEFTADAEVAKVKQKRTYYQELLSEVFQTQKISFINTFFNHSLIKKRIVMLQKSKSKKIYQLKYLLLLPVVCAMLLYTACAQESGELEASANLELKSNSNSEVLNAIANLKETMMAQGEISSEEERALKELMVLSDPNGLNSDLYSEVSESIALPFGVIDKVPIYPGCEGLSQGATKECFQKKITDFIVQNFKIENLKDSNISGKQRIATKFIITREGNIEIKGVKANHPDLEAEARWTLGLLPKMIPGEQDGKKVGVEYSLPILFELK